MSDMCDAVDAQHLSGERRDADHGRRKKLQKK